jgi:leucyl/phenylalanyl-tRNA--protein transferase
LLGGDLSPKRLQLAIKRYFPGLKANPLHGGHQIPVWFYFWRLVVTKSMRNILNRNIYGHFQSKFLSNFNCQQIKRDGQNGTWITNDMKPIAIYD